MVDDREDAIRSRAYELWKLSDRAHGQHDRHWLQAKEQLDGALDGGGDERIVGDERDRMSDINGTVKGEKTPRV